MSEKTKVVNIRVSEELYNSLNNTVEDIKKDTPRGATVSRNSVVTSAIEDFIVNRKKEKQGIQKFELNESNLKDLDIDELKRLDVALETKGVLNEITTNLEKEFKPAEYDVFNILNKLSDIVFKVYMEKSLKEAERGE